MKTITVAHQKGGVGKTTLVLNLAACLTEGLRVAVYDADAQGSLTGLSGMLHEKVTLLTPDQLKAAQRGGSGAPFDVLLVDTPPYLSSQLPALFADADFVLIPSKTGYMDVMAAQATLQLVRESQARKPGLKAAVVLTMVKPRTSLTAEIRELLQSVDVPVLTSTITERVSYVRSAIGGGVFEGDDDRAKEEITALADEIITLLGN